MSLSIRQTLSVLLLLLVIGAILYALVLYPFYGADFYHIFYPSGRAVLEGDTHLYTTQSSAGIFYPAHAMFYWILLAIAPLPLANGIQMLLVVGLMLATAHLWREFTKWDFLTIALAIANVYTIDQLIRGQIDVLAVFGLILAFFGAKKRMPHFLGLGATLAMIKPTNLALPLVMLAWSLRDWHWREIAKAAVIPLITFAATLLVFDIGWPLRFLERVKPPIPYTDLTKLTIWFLAEEAGIHVIFPGIVAGALLIGLLKHRQATAENFAFAIMVSYLISPYVGGYHYVAFLPALMCIRSRLWLVFCWLLSLLTFLRAYSFDYSWLAMLYPIAITMALLWQFVQDERGENEKPKLETNTENQSLKTKTNHR